MKSVLDDVTLCFALNTHTRPLDNPKRGSGEQLLRSVNDLCQNSENNKWSETAERTG